MAETDSAEPIAVEAPADPAAQAAPDLTGTWRLEVTLASRAKVPVVGDAKGASVSVLAVTLRPKGDGWVQRQEVCGVRVRGGGKVARTTLPPAFVQTIPPREYPASLTRVGTRWSYRADTGREIIGWDADATATMPREAGAEGVLDTDKDGKPGATIRMRIVGMGTEEMYITQEAHTVLEGWVVRPDRIEGRIDVRSLDQAVIGASHSLLDRDPQLRADEPASRFTMVRLPEGDDPCG